MRVKSDKDFRELRTQIELWRKRFPMFRSDVRHIEDSIETHIHNHSIALVFYRQTKKSNFLEDAQKEIDAINNIIAIVEKMELMSMLSRG
jgi:hypothetical protein